MMHPARRIGLVVLALAALTLAPALPAKLGPRLSVGQSYDSGAGDGDWGPQWVYAAALTGEWYRGEHGFWGLELGVDQVGRANAQARSVYDDQGVYQGVALAGGLHVVETQLAEALLLGWRWQSTDLQLNPRVYVGGQCSQALNQVSTLGPDFKGAGSVSYPDDAHRIRGFGLLGVGLGLGRQQRFVVDLRLSQELVPQVSGGAQYSKWQLGLAWLFSPPSGEQKPDAPDVSNIRSN